MLSDGNPEVLTPDLFSKMRRGEQKQVMNYFQRRLGEEGKGFSNRPDDEAPAVVARRAYMQGTFVVYLTFATPFVLGGAFTASFVGGGLRTPWTVGGLAFCVVVVLTLLGVWARKAVRINRYFVEFTTKSASPSNAWTRVFDPCR
ncbi:hypothetical protein [Nocardioides terrisoli]|uniref:hypothetical protein n=1 Tax=Nocardioides terrisoli TaxID=3388267 RepID=UPI00287BB76F|nr:hypothetical protein [Nocardioides marmorisolisilvae]